MARTVAGAVKDVEFDTSWRLEMLSTGEVDSKPLQGWRRLGTGNGDQTSRREQIAECLDLLSAKDIESPHLSPVEVGQLLLKDDLEFNREGNSDADGLKIMRGSEDGKPQESVRLEDSVQYVGGSARVAAGGNRLAATERSSSSLSNASEFRNADSFISEPDEDESKNDECLESREEKCLERDEETFDETEAYEFQIFDCDDVEKREPVSVFDLSFYDDEAEEYEIKFRLIASPSEPSVSNYICMVDSWTLRADEKAQLLLYVRDVKGKWYKLCTPARIYKAVFDDCHIVVSFLELAMKLGSKFKKPHTYYTKIQKLVRVDKSKIRDVLKKYYTCVVQKYVHKGGIPSLRDARIITKMKDSLKVSSETPKVSLVKTLQSGVQRKIATAIRFVSKRKRLTESYPNNIKGREDQKETVSTKKRSSKRKRVVVSDSEAELDGGTDEEDLKPLLQRKFKRKKEDQRSDFVSLTDDAMNLCSDQEQDVSDPKG